MCSYDEVHGFVEVFNNFIVIGSKTELRNNSSHVFKFFSCYGLDFISSDCLYLFNLIDDFLDSVVGFLETRIAKVCFSFLFFFFLFSNFLEFCLMCLISFYDKILVFDRGERMLCIVYFDESELKWDNVIKTGLYRVKLGNDFELELFKLDNHIN